MSRVFLPIVLRKILFCSFSLQSGQNTPPSAFAKATISSAKSLEETSPDLNSIYWFSEEDTELVQLGP